MNTSTFIGNLTADPVLRSKGDQTPRATFRLAVNEQRGEDNEVTHFVDFTAFGTLAENVVESLTKGTRIIVMARLNTYTKEVEIDGEEKNLTMVSYTASGVGPDLRWATAEVERNARPASSSKSRPAKSRARDEDEDDAPAPKAKAKARSGGRSKADVAEEDDLF